MGELEGMREEARNSILVFCPIWCTIKGVCMDYSCAMTVSTRSVLILCCSCSEERVPSLYATNAEC